MKNRNYVSLFLRATYGSSVARREIRRWIKNGLRPTRRAEWLMARAARHAKRTDDAFVTAMNAVVGGDYKPHHVDAMVANLNRFAEPMRIGELFDDYFAQCQRENAQPHPSSIQMARTHGWKRDHIQIALGI